MLRTLTVWELWLLGAFVLVVAEELVALLLAKRKGLTTNRSRVVTFSTLLVLAVVYGVMALPWLRVGEGGSGLAGLGDLPTANWGYLLLGVMIALVLAYEVSALVHARMLGLTRTVSRLAALLIAVLLLIVLIGISEAKWNLYLDRLEAVYSESLRQGG